MGSERGDEGLPEDRGFSARECLSLCSEAFSAVAKIVDENKLTEFAEVGIIRPSLVRLGEFINEIDEVRIAGHHECADDDLLPAALDGLVECFVDDAWVEAEGVFVQSAGFVEDRRRFSVCDHKDLFVDIAASA